MWGSEDGNEDERPVHLVTLGAFWLDRTEVTLEQYQACVEARACARPAANSRTQSSYYGNPEFANYPVTRVNWSDATSYCRWVGGRLPTEAEWEYAARGPESFDFPWGANVLPYCGLLNFDNCVGDTTEVGSYPAGASWIGALDMAGNLSEWVADPYDAGYYGQSPAQNPPGPLSGEYGLLRGGSWYDGENRVRSAFRQRGGRSDRFYLTAGFRCGQD